MPPVAVSLSCLTLLILRPAGRPDQANAPGFARCASFGAASRFRSLRTARRSRYAARRLHFFGLPGPPFPLFPSPSKTREWSAGRRRRRTAAGWRTQTGDRRGPGRPRTRGCRFGRAAPVT